VRRSLPAGTWSEQSVDLAALYARLGWPLPPLKRTTRGNVELLTRGTSLTLFVAVRNRPGGETPHAEFGRARFEESAEAPGNRIRERIAKQREYALALAQIEAERRNHERARALLGKAQPPSD
jgi:hypothetical protein